MFCQKCGSNLPDIAKYCARCGTRLQSQILPTGAGRFCVNCGKPYEPSFKFCNFCGHEIAQPHTTATGVEASTTDTRKSDGDYSHTYDSGASATESVAVRVKDQFAETSVSDVLPALLPEESKQIQAPIAPPKPLEVEQPPYAAFTLWFISTVGLYSCADFAIFQALARDTFSANAITVLIACIALGTVCTEGMRRAWRRVASTEVSGDDVIRRRRKRVIVKTVVFGILFLAAAAGTGYAIGQSGAQAAQVEGDMAEMRSLGGRITKARSPVGNPGISWYIQMYPQIEPDVIKLDNVLHRLATEYPAYAANFPGQDEQTRQFVANINTDIERMTLLEQEIAVAKKIQTVDESQQFSVWTAEMDPLLKKEDALDTH
jgi:hypothetical protein